ncbi:hypothetical protein N7535_008922 [Penicillium sp. DV-2018c]|nr:hypothetical protein N7535_008922 [Penicillium sp. DV-2018c]
MPTSSHCHQHHSAPAYHSATNTTIPKLAPKQYLVQDIKSYWAQAEASRQRVLNNELPDLAEARNTSLIRMTGPAISYNDTSKNYTP